MNLRFYISYISLFNVYQRLLSFIQSYCGMGGWLNNWGWGAAGTKVLLFYLVSTQHVFGQTMPTLLTHWHTCCRNVANIFLQTNELMSILVQGVGLIVNTHVDCKLVAQVPVSIVHVWKQSSNMQRPMEGHWQRVVDSNHSRMTAGAESWAAKSAHVLAVILKQVMLTHVY